MRAEARARPKERDQTPDLTGFLEDEVAFANHLMEELDEIWPKWRKITPLTPLKYHHRARVKWLLKRLKQISWRNPKGEPAPRLDWNVHVTPVRDDPDECIAHPTYPHQVDRADFWIPPKVEGFTKPAAGPSASVLSFELEMPLARVEWLLRNCPEGKDPRAHLIDIRDRTNPGTTQ